MGDNENEKQGLKPHGMLCKRLLEFQKVLQIIIGLTFL